MIDRYASASDMIGIAIIIGVFIKIYQFWREGKFKGATVDGDQRRNKGQGVLVGVNRFLSQRKQGGK